MSIVLLDDLCQGIFGIFSHKEMAPGKDNRYNIFYREAKAFGFWSKPKKLPGAIPPQGILDVPASKCDDGIARMIIFSYGADDANPPIIATLLRERVGDIIEKMDLMASQMQERESTLQADKRIFTRSKEEEIKRTVDMGKATQQQQRPPRGPTGFLNITEESD